MSCAAFALQWKTSIIVPHYKKGFMHNSKNFPSINHTPVPIRIMEEQLFNSWLISLLLKIFSTLPNAASSPTSLTSWTLLPRVLNPAGRCPQAFQTCKSTWPRFSLPNQPKLGHRVKEIHSYLGYFPNFLISFRLSILAIVFPNTVLLPVELFTVSCIFPLIFLMYQSYHQCSSSWNKTTDCRRQWNRLLLWSCSI